MLHLDLSIIIIEYHSLDEIKKCISSIKNNLYDITFEIIVSSNSLYTEDQQLKILKDFNDCTWTFNKFNGGFAYGMNRGMEIAKGHKLIIANPDIIIDRGLISMAKFMDKNPTVGAIGPMIYDEEKNIQDSCREYVTIQRIIWRFICRIISNREAVLNHNFDYNKTQTVDWIIGAFIMLRKDVFIQTGGLDEGYFMYAEDIDLCTRIRQLGFEIVYFPKTKLIYKGSRTARNFNKYTMFFIKSHLRYWRKHGFLKIYPVRKKLIF